uniref:4-nitrophenylphosphatase n=1 Tax=Heterorhabditis bacteriophora TaxID=37862 RepID=A0A1I7X1Q9_HETBA
MILPVFSAALVLVYETYIFDIDGVLISNNAVVKNSPEFVNYLYRQGKNVFFVTNNAQVNTFYKAEELFKYGFYFITPRHIITPLDVLINYFKIHNYTNSTIYLVSTRNIKETLESKLAIKVLGFEAHAPLQEHFDYQDVITSMKSKPSAVVIDEKPAFTMQQLATIINFLRDPEVKFFALGTDMVWKGPNDILCPGGGAIKSVVEIVTGRTATSFGKPSISLSDYIHSTMLIDVNRTIMFGDNLFTDIEFANSNGFDACLMLTGVHSATDVDMVIRKKMYINIPRFVGNFSDIIKELSNMISAHRFEIFAVTMMMCSFMYQCIMYIVVVLPKHNYLC